jgi:hypothetical protein
MISVALWGLMNRYFEGREGFVNLRNMRSFLGYLLRRYVDRVEELGMVVTIWYSVSPSGLINFVERSYIYPYTCVVVPVVGVITSFLCT